LLRTQHLVVCVNKMDAVKYSLERYDEIITDFKRLCSRIDVFNLQFIPTSALHGENITSRSKKLHWYAGPSLLGLLENTILQSDFNVIDSRLSIQCVLNNGTSRSSLSKLVGGRVVSGTFRRGDEVHVLPGGRKSQVKEIYIGNRSVEEAYAPLSTMITLNHNLEINRGDIIVRSHNVPKEQTNIQSRVFWLSERNGKQGYRFRILHLMNIVPCILAEIICKTDIQDNQHPIESINKNDTALVTLEMDSSIFFDSYWQNRITGSAMLMDMATDEIVAAVIFN